MSLSHRVAGVVVGLGRRVAAHLPKGLKSAIDDRIFGAIFQVTRVTNDAYGWPAPPAGGPGEPEEGVDRTPRG